MKKLGIDCLILNRNRRELTEALAKKLEDTDGVDNCFVVDSGSHESEIAKFTIVGDRSEDAIRDGLRPNRGFNLGLKAWLSASSNPWVLLLPNDAEIENLQIPELLEQLEPYSKISAIYPLAASNPTNDILGESQTSLAWNFHEGPLVVKRELVESNFDGHQVSLFSHDNFRGYCSFLELAMKVYASDRAIVATSLLSFAENRSHTINNHQLMKTEPYSENLALMIREGKGWLKTKFGWTDRRNLELIVRLLYEEFIAVNPDYSQLNSLLERANDYS